MSTITPFEVDLLPRSLVGAGTVNVVLAAGGQTANTVTMDIQ